MTITVNPVNDPPLLVNPIADITVAEDADDTVIDLSAVFTDVDTVTNGDLVGYSVTSSDTGLVTTTAPCKVPDASL